MVRYETYHEDVATVKKSFDKMIDFKNNKVQMRRKIENEK